jgi:hypothetical protein
VGAALVLKGEGDNDRVEVALSNIRGGTPRPNMPTFTSSSWQVPTAFVARRQNLSRRLPRVEFFTSTHYSHSITILERLAYMNSSVGMSLGSSTPISSCGVCRRAGFSRQTTLHLPDAHCLASSRDTACLILFHCIKYLLYDSKLGTNQAGPRKCLFRHRTCKGFPPRDHTMDRKPTRAESDAFQALRKTSDPIYRALVRFSHQTQPSSHLYAYASSVPFAPILTRYEDELMLYSPSSVVADLEHNLCSSPLRLHSPDCEVPVGLARYSHVQFNNLQYVFAPVQHSRQPKSFCSNGSSGQCL